MRKTLALTLAVACFFSLVGIATAQSDTQQITITVEPINQIAVSGDVTLTVDSTKLQGGAGGSTLSTSDNSTKISYSTNEAEKKITVGITAGALPAGVTALTVAAGAGVPVDLVQGGGDLITGISNTSAADVVLTFELEADLTLSPDDDANLTVTYTLVDM